MVDKQGCITWISSGWYEDYLDTQVEEVMMDLIQSLEERKMTDFEMDKREKIVLSLKKRKKISKIDMVMMDKKRLL